MPQAQFSVLTSDDAAFIAGTNLSCEKKQGSAQARTAQIALCLGCASLALPLVAAEIVNNYTRPASRPVESPMLSS